MSNPATPKLYLREPVYFFYREEPMLILARLPAEEGIKLFKLVGLDEPFLGLGRKCFISLRIP